MKDGKPDADPKLTKRQAENVRANIARGAQAISNRLHQAALGEIDMSPSAVNAAKALLDRVLPTMQSIDQTNHTDTPELTPDEIDAMLATAVRDMARKDPDKLKAMLDQPKLVAVK